MAAAADHRLRTASAADVGTIDELRAASAACSRCRLARERTTVVRGTGPTDADVVVVAEAPGYHEDRAGQLLVGRVAELFDDLLTSAGMSRSDVYVTGVVRCRPPRNRAPFPDEIEACEGWLFRELALVRPRVVVTLGAVALRLVTGRHGVLGSMHGTRIDVVIGGREVIVWPVYHPAAALHVPALLPTLREELRSIPALLRASHADDEPRAARPPDAERQVGADPLVEGEGSREAATITAAVDRPDDDDIPAQMTFDIA